MALRVPVQERNCRRILRKWSGMVKRVNLAEERACSLENQVAEEWEIADNVQKSAFRCPGCVSTFEWVVMPFSLKNARATYQRAMNVIFHYLLGKNVEVYIDDVVVKSRSHGAHLQDLKQAFGCMRLKTNSLKCAFGISTGNFLGFLVYRRGVEIEGNKAQAILEAQLPTYRKELQCLLGQVNFLRRFISNLAGRTQVFSILLKKSREEEFHWGSD
ncbi:hypothetical protein CRG98_000982 [Punica granatum]|uniref:Reverse transcriptase domain-containing protein n=1 Tax=Punica granatum TaxID=22663 RepID=A0A2I0LD49_PUNGR|nr:hypothetical protein CRG98_000982 [Punica granatum]